MAKLTAGHVHVRETAQLSPAELRAIRALLHEAFSGDFGGEDWANALGGWHVIAGPLRAPVAHASVVLRRLQAGARMFNAGYVEAVGVRPDRQRSGLGTAVMRPLNDLIRRHFELGALSTSVHPFYTRLGWERWHGPTWVRAADGRLVRTADEDEGILVLRCEASLDIDVAAPLTCDERPGDCW
jgi:aminoglycoside 2'-N-acetyltransferase I